MGIVIGNKKKMQKTTFKKTTVYKIKDRALTNLQKTMKFIDAERPCTATQSLEQSLKEMKSMRQGEMNKRSWKKFKTEL